MRSKNTKVIQAAQSLAGRFGFLTKELFFRHLCRASLAQQYRYWAELTHSGLFFQASHDPNILYLSRIGRKRINDTEPMPARSSLYIDHDTRVADTLLTLEQTGLVLRFWTEGELRRSPWDTMDITGSRDLSKIPDLIFDLKTLRGQLRVAFEVERSFKTRERYAQLALSYLDMPNVEIVIFASGNPRIEEQIRRAFRGKAFEAARKIPGIFSTDDFVANRLQAQFWFHQRQYTIAEFLQVATGINNFGTTSGTPVNEKPFSFRKKSK